MSPPPILSDYWQRNTENTVYKFNGPLSLACCFHATLAQAAPWLGKDVRQAFTALHANRTNDPPEAFKYYPSLGMYRTGRIRMVGPFEGYKPVPMVA